MQIGEESPQDNVESMIREVRDFEAGIFYRVFEEYSNCTVHKLTDIDSFEYDDVAVDANGHPVMPHWYSMFKFVEKLTINSGNMESRGISIEYLQNVTDGYSLILGLSDSAVVDSDGSRFLEWPSLVEWYFTQVKTFKTFEGLIKLY